MQKELKSVEKTLYFKSIFKIYIFAVFFYVTATQSNASNYLFLAQVAGFLCLPKENENK